LSQVISIRIFLTVVALGLVFGGLYFTKHSFEGQEAAQQRAMLPPPPPVAVAPATATALPLYIEAIGTLEAVRQVVVVPEVGGRVVAIHFESGDMVRGGAPLVQLNDAPERGDLHRFRAIAEFAQQELERVQSITDRRAISQSNLDEAKRRFGEARGDIARTEALIEQKLIRAPFDGVLGVRKINLGQYLQPGQPIVTLTNLDTLYVNFTVPENELSQLTPRLPVQLRSDAFPERTFAATITTIEPQVAVEMQTASVQATLANRDHLLRPGMFTAVRVVLPPERNVITVPETAVDKTIYGDSVFIVRRSTSPETTDPRYTAERVYVKTGRRADGRIAVLEGVAQGDLVITAGQVNLVSGMPVSLSPTDTLAEKGKRANGSIH